MTGAFILAAALAAQVAAPSPGDLALARGDFDGAFLAYTTAFSALPNDFDTLLGLGTIDLYRGALCSARFYLGKALRVKPNDETAERRLHTLQILRGEPGDLAVSIERPEVDVAFIATDPLPMVRARIDGTDLDLLIDTGASTLALSQATARKLGVAMHRSGVGIFAGGRTADILSGRVDMLAFPGVVVRSVPVDQLPAGMPTTLEGRSYDGIIGTTFLRQFLSTIDYRNARLILRPRSASGAFEAAAAARKVTVAPMWLVPDHFIFARARVNAKLDGLFSIDTGGAGVGITLTKSALVAANISLDPSKASSGIGGGGTVQVVPFTAGTVSLDSFQREDVPGIYTPAGDPYGRFPFAVAGALSHEFFRSSSLTFDFTAMKLVVERPVGDQP